VSGAVVQTDAFHDLPYHRRVLGSPVQEERQCDIVPHREARQEIEGLKHETQLPSSEDRPPPFGYTVQILSVDLDSSGTRLIDSSQHVQECALAGPTGTDDGDKLSVFDRDIYIAKRGYPCQSRAVPFTEPVRSGDYRIHGLGVPHQSYVPVTSGLTVSKGSTTEKQLPSPIVLVARISPP
jgi:hypothetical protein